jgi:hypothetical protein
MDSAPERLIRAREEAGYTILHASRLSGVSAFELRRFEAGNALPCRLDLRRLCVLYGGTGDFWMGRGEERKSA